MTIQYNAAVTSATCADRVTLLNSLTDVPGLAQSALWDESKLPTEQWPWAVSCATSALGKDRTLAIATWRGDALSGFLPLVCRVKSGIKRLGMLGAQELAEPGDLVCVDDSARETLLKSLLTLGRPFVLERLPADSPTIPLLQQLCQGRAKCLVRPQASAPVIRLDATWQDPWFHLNSGRRSDMRRARRKAEQLGEVTVEILAPSPEQTPNLLQRALEIEAKSWKGDSGSALLHDEVRREFFFRYAAAAAEAGILRLSFLRAGETDLAMQIAVQTQNGLWLFKIGYDAAHSACSPGQLLMGETIAYASREGLATYEFLGAASSWTEVWTKSVRECVRVQVYPYSPCGSLALAADGAARAWNKRNEFLATAKGAVKQRAKKCINPILRRATAAYVAGESLADAEQVAAQFRKQNLAITLGYWDGPSDQPKHVEKLYSDALHSIAAHPGDYLSIKLPALGNGKEELDRMAGLAQELGVRLHFDALLPGSVDQTKAALERLRKQFPNLKLSTTLPARWRRSESDADWAIAHQFTVRIVKGQWADPNDPAYPSEEGFNTLAKKLSGQDIHVAIATHNVSLGVAVLQQLQASGTSCEWEFLYGLPRVAGLKQAAALGIPARVYVPYGESFLPYAFKQTLREPRKLWWLARDLFLAKR
jgi:CelD/BcsL family acetyltransferase involved in cellulose biosynthesis